jgi:hypothetical protein
VALARTNARSDHVVLDFSFSQPSITVAFLCIKAKKVKEQYLKIFFFTFSLERKVTKSSRTDDIHFHF